MHSEQIKTLFAVPMLETVRTNGLGAIDPAELVMSTFSHNREALLLVQNETSGETGERAAELELALTLEQKANLYKLNTVIAGQRFDVESATSAPGIIDASGLSVAKARGVVLPHTPDYRFTDDSTSLNIYQGRRKIRFGITPLDNDGNPIIRLSTLQR